MEFLWGKLVIALFIGALLLARSKFARPLGRLSRLTYPWTIKLLGLFGCAALSLFLYVGVRDSPNERWGMLACIGPLWLLAVAGLIHALSFEVSFDDDLIYATSAWSGSKFIAWQDISSVTEGSGKTIIQDSHRNKIAINHYMSGAKQLVDLASVRAAQNRDQTAHVLPAPTR
jgi:hypothetical protein